MKTYLIMILIALHLQANTTMIDNIAKTLKTLEYETSHTTQISPKIKYDPFYHDGAKKKSPKKIQQTATRAKKNKKGLELSMILNKKAFINHTWYKKNDKVEQYMLHQVRQDSVVLRYKNKYITLKLSTNNNLLVKTEVK